MKTLLTTAAILVALIAPTHARERTITMSCTGTLIDVWLKSNDEWPLAVIHGDGYTCTIDRTGSRHDPLRFCNVNEKCRVTGDYQIVNRDPLTYRLRSIDNIEGAGDMGK